MTADQEPSPRLASQDLTRSPAQTLAEALGRCDLQLDAEVVAQLDAYRASLWRWNEKLNLTRHTTFDKFAERMTKLETRMANLETIVLDREKAERFATLRD